MCDQTRNIHVNSIKRHSTYAYKYDYIQAIRVNFKKSDQN
jgi:hypothetical protein